jgi:hypothetical protein
MRTIVTIITAALAFTTSATAQTQFKCKGNQGVEYILDFATDSNNDSPLFSISYEIVSQQCVAGPTSYQLKGFAGRFNSAPDAKQAFDAMRTIVELGIKSDEHAANHSFVLEAQKRGTVKPQAAVPAKKQ